MKKVIFLLISAVLVLTLSCQDNLDIEPQQAISTEVALSTEQGIKTALVGAYSLWGAVSRTSGNILLNSELLIDSDNLYWTNFFFGLTQIINKQIATDNEAVESFWINSYRIVNQVNTILSALEVVENDRDIVAAEARFLRGMTYFDLVNLYAKTWGDGDPASNPGVPIITLPSEKNLENPIVPRNSVVEVYEFILQDFQFAKTHLPEQNNVFATTYAASAYLSRVYLMQEQYARSLEEADRVIESDAYQLVADLPAVFNASNNTSEDIFAIQKTVQDFGHSINYYYCGELEGGGGFIGITDEHLAKYDPADQRRALFYLDKQSGTRRTAKWRPNASNNGNIALIRLAEMYLTRAESRFLTGDLLGASEDLNIIRNRAGLPPLAVSDLTLDTILKERFLELVFEGHQFRDAKRTKQNVRDLPYSDPRLIYPIPQRDLAVNPALVQNEGY